jgi:RNA polymerase primary sigma factor
MLSSIKDRPIRTRVESLLPGNFDFMDSPVFRRKAIERKWFSDAPPELPPIGWYQPTRDEPADPSVGGLPRRMKGDEERLMFHRFNYCKMRLSQLKRRFSAEGMTVRTGKEFLEWHRRFEHYREYLVRTNLALVLAMAKRTRLANLDFAEMVSEGNMALLRAVQKFNVDLGFKFSTYACRAILKTFSRMSMKASKYHARFPVEFEPDLEKSDWHDKRRDVAEDESIDELKTIVDRNLADLSSTEQTVIRRRFNWEQQDESRLTLADVGRLIGVTKERVRQIQNKALAKIRSVMEDGVLRIRPRPALSSARA